MTIAYKREQAARAMRTLDAAAAWSRARTPRVSRAPQALLAKSKLDAADRWLAKQVLFDGFGRFKFRGHWFAENAVRAAVCRGNEWTVEALDGLQFIMDECEFSRLKAAFTKATKEVR